MAVFNCKSNGGDLEDIASTTIKEETKPAGAQTEVPAAGPAVAPLLERVFMFLEDGNWSSADAYCEKVLDIEPKNAQAYLGKLMAELKVQTQDALRDCAELFDGKNNYQKALRFADDSLKKSLTDAIAHIKTRNETDRLEKERLAELARKEAKRKAERNKKIFVISAAVAVVIVALVVIWQTVLVPMWAYDDAVALEKSGKLPEAAVSFGKAGDYRDAKARSLALWDPIAVRETISAGYHHTIGLRADGTVVAVGSNLGGDVTGWQDIVAISAGWHHTVGLKADGTVVAVGWNEDGPCDVTGWKDIVAISAGHSYTVGLKADGTVVAVGSNYSGQCDVTGWEDIVAISAGYYHTVGLKADGTVVAVGDNKYSQCNVTGWKDIVAISAGEYHTVGLKADGTVVAVGWNKYSRCDVTGWQDIVAISAGGCHTIGLKADGTVVAVGYNLYDRCDVTGWEDIVAISAGDEHTVGLKADGTVVAVGSNKAGQCDVDDWKNIRVPKKD